MPSMVIPIAEHNESSQIHISFCNLVILNLLNELHFYNWN